ncbi:esterase-like activity of phytase family protein [Duganella callida]|uniref:Esterase-like activity of phytase family protein n=1 Tax=Duganella callida TaxID=2561932 RepID=A0A4Y9S2T9_9BURK|nr:esterase-like activity of phytase family protein [Duganella callida]TFW14781.1 esterase-like activity of phytase family protein [Duganella callida]
MKKTLITVACALALSACAPFASKQSTTSETVSGLRFIGEQRIPLRQQYHNTVIGGLSGIDYDAASDEWVMISDDRSNINPARYYRAKLKYDAQSFQSVQLTGVETFLQLNGAPYQSKEEHKRAIGEVPDLETIRVDPRDGSIWYGSEGDVDLELDPFIRHATRDGKHLYTLPLPPLFKVSRDQKSGPRNNQSFEGLSFTPDGQTMWVSLEAPMYQDGPEAAPEHGGVNRFTHFTRDGKVLGQYAYPLEAIPARPGKGKYADNGVSEILALSEHRMLVMERSGVQADNGTWADYVRIYELDTEGASDIQHLPTLKGASYTPAKKRLVLDLNKLNLPIVDNLEGLAFGPRLANGHASLVMISDDNFSKTQVTQFLLFEVIP